MNSNKILTFSGSKTKAEIVAMARWHRDQDLLTQGNYGNYCEVGQKIKGCSVGCMFPNRHSDGYPVAGVCPQLLQLVDKYFEKSKTAKEAADWHVWFWENLPENKNSWEIFSQFMGQMLIDPSCGAFGKSEKSDKHLKSVSDLFLAYCDDKNKYVAARTAAHAARAAAAATAYAAAAAAADAHAAYAAAATAYAAARAAYTAAHAAAAAADAHAAYAAAAATAATATAYATGDAHAAAAYQNQINLLKKVIISFQ